jgi:DNA-binding PadR family transcriptional regulator
VKEHEEPDDLLKLAILIVLNTMETHQQPTAISKNMSSPMPYGEVTRACKWLYQNGFASRKQRRTTNNKNIYYGITPQGQALIKRLALQVSSSTER